MSVEAPGPKKSPLEKFSEAPDAARESSLQLAAWRHSGLVNPNLSPGEQAEIVQHVDSAIKARREIERGLRLSSGRQLQQVGAPTILNNAMEIVKQAEHVVAERFEHAWAANIAPKNASHDLVAEIAEVLDAKNPQQAFRTARVSSAHIQRLTEKEAQAVVEGIALFGTLPPGSLHDDDAVAELIENWNTSFLLPTRTPPDIAGRNTHDEEQYAKQMIKGQTVLNGIVARAPRVKSEFNHDELWALAEYYGEVKGAWRKKRAIKRFGTAMPAIKTLVAKVDELQGGKSEGRLQSWLRNRDSKRAGTDEAAGRERINAAALKVLESHWKGADAAKVGTYLRLWVQQLRGGGWARQTLEESAIYREGQGVLTEAARRTQQAERISRPKVDTSPSSPPAPRIPAPEPTRALPPPEVTGEEGVDPSDVLREMDEWERNRNS